MFSENLVSLRKRAGLSQEDLANAIDVSRQTISKYETGAAEPSLARLTKLSAFLNVSVDQLVAQPLAPVSATPATSSTGLMIKSALTGTLSAVIKFEIATVAFPGKYGSRAMLLGANALGFWNEAWVVLGWYATRQDAAQEIQAIEQAMRAGQRTYQLHHNVKVRKTRLFGRRVIDGVGE